jgi:hypothetical protein
MKQLIWTTTNFIVPCIIIFLAFLAFFLYPRTFRALEGSSMAGAICSDPPPGYPTIKAPDYAINSFYQVDGEGNNGGFVDSVLLGPEKNYKMIKANVPFQEVGEAWFHFIPSDVFVQTPGGKRQVIWPTGISGKYIMVNNQEVSDVLFMTHGIIFLQHLDQQNKPRELTINGKKIPIVDIYKQVDKPEVRPNAFLCTEEANVENSDLYSSYFSRVVIPEQNQSKNNEQLQLEYFVFDKPKIKVLYLSSGCKPAVYLYPPQKQLVNVKVSPKGFLTYTDPIYDLKNGWTVDAYPDGKIYDSRFAIYDKPFNYLYYESKIHDEVIQKPTKGWVVTRSQLEPLYRQILPKLGLNNQQMTDFIEYWNKALTESPYYFVGVMDQKNIDQIERLEITPKPDIINRVRIYFERLDQPRQVEAPNIVDQRTSELVNQTLDPDLPIHQSTNSLFRVVEWGGMVKNDPNHPFTCSQ